MCSSLRSWFLYLHRDGFVLTSKKEQAVYLDAAKATRKGMVKQEWNTRVGCVQFSPNKLQTYRNGSTTYSLRQNPLDNCWMRPRRCKHTYLTRVGHLLAVGSLRILKLPSWNKDWSVASSLCRWLSGLQWLAFRSYVEKKTNGLSNINVLNTHTVYVRKWHYNLYNRNMIYIHSSKRHKWDKQGYNRKACNLAIKRHHLQTKFSIIL